VQRGSLVGLIALLVLAATTGGLAGSALAQEESPAGTPTPDGATNETVRHVNPDETNRNGDLAALQSLLASRMAERLTGSSIELSQGQYDLARQLVGEEYRDQYGKYVDVNGETREDSDTEEFERARERQREFTDEVQSYNETREEYREAKRSGNEQRARELARALEQQAKNVSETSEQLNRSYGNVSDGTGVDLTRASAAVRNVTEDILAQQAEIRAEEFEQTILSVTPQSEAASFANPQIIDGRLRTESGSALANRTVVIRVAERRATVETNATGAFTLKYRPVTTRAASTSVTVRYVPVDTSVYLGARANASFVVEQVDSAVSVERLTPRATFGTPVEVSGEVTAAGRGVPGVPVVVSIEGTRLARGTTTEDGRFSLAGSLPASVPVGTRTVTVRVPLEDRAIGGSETTRTLEVTETATSLTLKTETTGTTVTLTGGLTTQAGDGIAGQQLEIRQNGSLVTTTQTGPEGRYEATVSGEAGERYRVAVRYEEPSTNLQDASASAVVTLPPANGGSGGGGVSGSGADGGLLERISGAAENPLVVLGALLGLGAVPVLVLVAWRINRRGAEGQGESEQGTVAETGIEGAEDPGQSSEGESDPLAVARSAVDENTDAAVESAYSVTRGRLGTEAIASPDATHWEFYQACVAAGLDNPDALEALTSLYERAAFSPSKVSRGDAEIAVAEASRLI
jgi:hypothetical protein